MKYFTTADLEGLRNQHVLEWIANVKSDPAQAKLSIFLSHSHHDRPLVEGLIRFFATQGVTIYVDWNDGSMPRITNRETAAKLKKRIESCAVFMVLATQNAIESKWVSWEVGVADQMKGEERITVIPVADPSGRYPGGRISPALPAVRSERLHRLAVDLRGRERVAHVRIGRLFQEVCQALLMKALPPLENASVGDCFV